MSVKDTKPGGPPLPDRVSAIGDGKARVVGPKAAAIAAAPSAQPRDARIVSLPAAGEARVAELASPRPRHRAALASFLLVVALPALVAAAYLHFVAHDQYASRTAFSVRGHDAGPPVEFLGALTRSFGGGAGADAEIVYEFVRSQQMVEAALAALPLREIYNLPERDPVFTLGEDRAIEDVVTYWRRMTSVSFDGASGIVNFEARAFDRESAQGIAQLVLDESTRVVNELSLKAREDAVSVAREVVVEAEERLREVRRRLRAFRDIEQELDPSENARASLGLISSLEAALAQARVDLDTQRALVGERSPRVGPLLERIEALETRIADERTRVGGGEDATSGPSGRRFSDLVAEYEELIVDREFAEKAYVSALASFEQAQVEARRQMRYLSPHVRPTLAVSAEYPQRTLLSLGVFAALTVGWAVFLLIAYNVRDRR